MRRLGSTRGEGRRADHVGRCRREGLRGGVRWVGRDECPAPRSGVDRWLTWSAGQSRRRVAPEGLSGGRLSMGRSTEGRAGLSEQRKYRTFTAQKKLEIVLAGLRGDRSVREVCREHAVSETLFYGWRDQLLE